MLEGLIAWVLNNYLGKYVSNLNTDQLSVALLKGAVELENLPLKKDALKELLPFEVKAGFIGKITLQIPFYRPHIDPWVISVSRLHVIGSPEKQEEFDEEREKLLEKENKKATLLALEEKWKKEGEQIAESYWYSVTASVVARIIENIELNIQDVHLRFEDGVTSPSQPFAFGICIKNVSIQNATEEPVEELMKKKQLDISDFSIYWDSDCTLWGDLLPGELQEAMDNSMESRDHNYIMEPVCTSALLKSNRSKKPLRSRNMPRLEFDIQLETIPLKLSQMQYRQIMDFLKELDRKERQLKFRKWRPKVPIAGNCREWWLFALNVHLAEIREQKEHSSWEFMLHRAQDAVLYTDLYYKKLKELPLSDEEQEEMERVEDEQTFEELKILREIVYNKFQELAEQSIKKPLSDSLDSASEAEQEGSRSSSGMLQYLQSWFPGWGGWHSQSQEALETKTIEGLLSETAEQWRPEDVAGADDIFDPATDVSSINTFTKRDHVLAKLNLWLQGGSITLLHTEKRSQQASESAFMQLQFSGVTVLAETLPRRNSSLLKVQLGSLFLQDLATEGTIFPVLVFPNPLKEVGCVSSVSLQTSSSDTSNQSPDDPLPVFEMLYEKNPVRSNFERRLEVSTQPLNIIYNPQAIKKVADFFYKGKVHSSGFGCQSELELRVAEVVRRQYNKLKMQTEAEIRQTIDQLLVGDFIEDSRRWSVCLDISAPQVIFPDDFKSADPVLVVIDLGRMLLTNSQEEHRKKSPDGLSLELSDLSDDEYKTPLATPPNSPPPEVNLAREDKTVEFPGVKNSEKELQVHLMSKKIYETYSLSFMDLQIMVGRVKDNWKYAQDIDVGPTHVVEKFNVHLQLERRLIYTSDPTYPGVVLSGNLPDLKIHINEDKIMALNNCFGRLSTSDSETLGRSQIGKEAGLTGLEQRGSLHSSVVNLTQSVIMVEQHTKEVLIRSRLLLAEFQVNCMQLAVESNGRYIAVLKVFGTDTHFVKRPYDVEGSLTVHGLLLVDTMQTYGSDFDLLMASHKNLSFDVPTGSLQDSKAQSPVSGLSETLLVDEVCLTEKCTQVSERLSNSSPKRDESLIKLEYQFVTAECPSANSDSFSQVLLVQMNNLDIILNPETIVELIGFLQKSFPKEKDDCSPQPLMTNAENIFSEQENFQSTHSPSTEVTVEIHWLNILLLRTVTLVNREKFGRKIATASIGGTKVNVSMDSRLKVNGSLGCLHLMDLTQDNMKNQYVVSIGNTEQYENLVGYSKPTLLQFEDANSLPDALSFTFSEQSAEECSLHLQMASLHYNHSAKFLKEITLSMDELEENFRGMLKSAATKVTTVLATKTAEYSEMVSLFDTVPKSRDPFNLENDEGEEVAPVHPKTETIKLILKVNIESPVVSIPRKPGSPELLVGHLGQISIQNFVTGEDNLRSDSLQVEIKDIKMYSLNCSHLTGKKDSPSEVSPMLQSPSGIPSCSNQEESQFTRHDFFESLHKGQAFHILNNATIQFMLEKIPVEHSAELAFSLSDDVNISSLMRIEGRFVNPLQVMLAKHVYEQVMQTLDNLVCNEDLTKPPSSFPSSTYSSSVSPSVSLRSISTDFSVNRKENGFFTHSSFSTNKCVPVKEAEQSFTQLQATFHISELQVQLSGDLTLGAQGLVSLTFQDFDVDFAKDHPDTLSIQIALRSLLMEDLLEKNPDSLYKNLMVSRGAPKSSNLTHKEYLSQSCPLVSNVEYPDMPRSLPSHMEEAPNVFQFYQRPSCISQQKRKEDVQVDCPLTPPPSPTARQLSVPCGRNDFDDSLVHINMLLVNQKHPEFSSRYGKISRSVDIDFNCLDVLITLQTWVVILDFFGIGSTAENHSVKVQTGDVQHTVKSETSVLSASKEQASGNSKLDLKVHSLSLVLNKATNELAKANVSKLVTHMEKTEGDLAFHGSIGSLSLSDLTSHGELYRERFTTSGEEALTFQVYRYGQPDPSLQRECDMRVSLRMASVQYIHTQRFQAEVISFIQHFTQLQDVLGRQRAAVEGQTVRDQAQQAARILLDLEAGAPVLLIPESSTSSHLIVANLGKLKVKNRFLFAGSSGTFSLKDKQDSVQFSSPLGTPKHSMKKTPSADESKMASHSSEGLHTKQSSGPILSSQKSERAAGIGAKLPPSSPLLSVESPEEQMCLLDCIVVDLQDMDIFAAERYPREHSQPVKDASVDLTFPSFVIKQTGGSLLTEPFRLKLQVERNLDMETSHAVPNISIHGIVSSVHCSLDLNKYKLIRGLLENNLGEPIEEFIRPYDLQDPRIQTVLSGEVYTCLSFLIDMVNVSLELTSPQPKQGSLARFDFKKSKLLFESFSNKTKSINLVSHSMMAFDTRYAGQKPSSGMPNVFNCIFQSSKNSNSQGAIQIELHYRSTKDSSSFTVVLNNLRVFLIFDWLVLVHDFLQTPSDTKQQSNLTPSRQRSHGSEMAVIPKAVKCGIVTKRSSLQISTEKQLEVKVNVTDTEFVVVEDMSCMDTNAIILKGTTVLTYKPKLVDHPFSGSLSGIEVFSCRLGNEQETALSILDPALIQVELVGNSSYPNGSGLLDAFNGGDFPPLLEIQLQALDIRLSYNDVQLFLAIAKSISKQTSGVLPNPPASDSPASSSSSCVNEISGTASERMETTKRSLDPVLEVQLARLQELGFRLNDCRKALLDCQGQLKKAASWLFKNAEPLKHSTLDSGSLDGQSSMALRLISGVEVKAESVCICFIDDCMDCDVPLAELTFSRLNFLQHLRASPEGYAHFTLSGDYYNRELSGWEPFIEPWPCSVFWQKQPASRLHPARLKLEVKAKQRLDINITSRLIEQYASTKQSWMADYCKQEKEVTELESEEWVGSSVDPPSFRQGLPLVYLRTRSTASLTNLEHQMYARAEMKAPKRRQPFVPFALRNHTGCTLWFATLTTTPTRAALLHSGSPAVIPEENGTFLEGAHKVSEWREVLTGEEVPFAFEAKGKLRHRHTHDLRIHQLQVRVNGWEEVSPVSVDKVGIFFRYAAPDKSSSSSTVGSPISRTNIIHPQVYFSSLPPVRVVFAVTMEGSARKVITVRSALIVKNKLEMPMELRLDSPSAPDKPVVLPSVMPGDSFAIPLHLTSWRLQARPKGTGVFFCKSPIHWTNVQKTSEVSSSKRECHSMELESSRFFRFCVAIKKENYPDYMPSSIFSDSAKQIFRQPGHTIYLLPTVVLCNLLPCELEFYVKGLPINGTLKPRKEVVLHTADTSQKIELGISLENFTHCKELLIPPGTQNYVVRMRLYDNNRRLLNLTIRIVCRAKGSLKIFISAPYWLINKTGLPLIFRQDNAKTDAAGQFEEHELARSLSPLLFCYADKEQPNLCTMRVGRGIHPEGMPGWCQGFSLDGGSGVRALKVIQQGNRPGLIYNIGIDVKKGRGRYIDTCMVTFAPRYLLDNKSTHTLAFAQRAFARGQGTSNPDGYISTLPGSSVVFHWPRNDYDQLLCVRLMDIPNCIWSGGFEVSKNNSFHINMRDTLGRCIFLQVEITLKRATYCVVFSDTDQFPPPYRIDNFSKVPVVFTQYSVVEPRLSTEVKPGTSLDYAWDEPTLPPYVTLTVKGAGSSEITCCMNDFQESKQLYYENFIYIAATYTFSGVQEETGRPVAANKEVDSAELVLDVSPKTQRVILKKKEPGKRSQLWRMTGTGMLCHEGSAVPHHPDKPSPPRSAESSMILDIAGLAAVTDNRYEPLMLRKPDRRRSTTQTWSFRDGKLLCGMHGLAVQAKGGRAGLRDGAEVVLGPDTSLELLSPVPPEQQFINQKMRPGSGALAVQVIPDGPTRVLQITDFNQRRNDRLSYEGEELDQDLWKLKNPDLEQELEVQLKLEGGIGLSLVNKAPEELIFASFTGINVHFTQLSASQVLELSIQDVQVDNQLLRTTQPFMLFLTPKMSENETAETGPAVQLNAMKFPGKSPLSDIYKHLMITASKFTVQIEEKLLLKLLSFFGYNQSESEVENYDENLHEKPVSQDVARRRYYFENLKISVPQIKLSVFTSSKLPLDLKALKSTLGFPLVRFEDAVINLDPYTRVHPYETKDFIINDVLKHFQEELVGQAARILSSVDFLGNPMGLLTDVSEGVTGLIKYGNVGGLIRNVAHGVSNSAAKVTGTLSDGLGKTMDSRHQTEREYIRYHAATSGEHLVAGIHGLAHGIVGGLTSVITSTLEGVKTEGGVSGFISGLGKGLVGTLTKPVAGALDFASETAQAVRETTTLTGPRTQAERVRKPRCCRGPQGLLPRYSESQAEGQELFFKLTDNIQDEFFIAVENVDRYCVIISSKAVYFLKSGDVMDREAIFLEVKYDDLYHCLISRDHGQVYVQLTKKAVNSSSGVSMPGPSHQKPMVHVTTEELAVRLCQEINYAKSLFYEQQLMLRSSEHQEQLELDS
ncbi:vacuolar protein sorting-associated protein 13D isoform X1 [Python bivittatus]|uniref:Vacuolar protein sorting-associated protein 13D isoform X1 n=1 Tax=Python bivittatus TaxID=176946 RepID=A0A9F5MWM0_PYTBI|nr:vacuolar protein sorting-associated protein 13D isoform X1 [Python bivittatus]